MSRWFKFRCGLVIGVSGAAIAGSMTALAQLRSLPVRVDRWLAVEQLTGQVTYSRRGQAQPARVGDRLQQVGDSIVTLARSTATLAIDENVGLINVAEKTALRIQSLLVASDNGRITRLQVTGGQVRFKVRRFNHRGSRLEINTPAGVSGVRGTEFGVAVQPGGKTGLATLSGSVSSAAQGQTVLVRAGWQNFTLPGEAPSSPVPLRNDTSLRARFLKEFVGPVRQLRLVGQVDPVNSVIVDGVARSTDRAGRFNVTFLVPSRLRVRVIVITPLGKTQQHDLEFS